MKQHFRPYTQLLFLVLFLPVVSTILFSTHSLANETSDEIETLTIVQTDASGSPLEGVGFSTIKIGDTKQVNEIASSAHVSTELVLNEAGETLLEILREFSGDASLTVRNAEELQKVLTSVLLENGGDSVNRINAIAYEGMALPVTDENGCSSAELTEGIWLLAVRSVPNLVSGTGIPFVVVLPSTNESGTGWNTETVVHPKESFDAPSFCSDVAEITSNPEWNGYENTEDTRVPREDSAFASAAAASTGDTIAVKLTADLPKITTENTYLTHLSYSYELPSGWDRVDEKKVILTWYDENGNRVAAWTESDGTFDVEDSNVHTVHIEITEAGLSRINPNSSLHTVTIDFDTVFSGDEAESTYDFVSQATMTYARTNEDSIGILTDTNRVFTGGLNCSKEFSGKEGHAENTAFTLINKTDGISLAFLGENGHYRVSETGEASSAELVPNEDGELILYGLEPDSYELTEIRTDDGFLLLSEPIAFELIMQLTEVPSEDSCSHENHAILRIYGSPGEADRPLATFTIQNTAKPVPPKTETTEKEIPNTGDHRPIRMLLIGTIVSGIGFITMIGITRKKNEK